mmetsp:Transcript_29871/g.51590  ORF Transcript_29871/g.51590 Transcript_29871/m.51590 type:complete len:96 (+) Transcript_29871:1-288(+)
MINLKKAMKSGSKRPAPSPPEAAELSTPPNSPELCSKSLKKLPIEKIETHISEIEQIIARVREENSRIKAALAAPIMLGKQAQTNKRLRLNKKRS